MALSDEGLTFLAKYCDASGFLKARLAERREELRQLAARPTGGEHVIRASDIGRARDPEDKAGENAAIDAADAAAAKLGAKLEATGRGGDQQLAPGRKTQHLTEILLRDEDGLNAKQITDKIATVDRATRELAARQIDSGMTQPEKNAIADARQKVAHAKAAVVYVETQMAQLQLATPGSSPRDGKNRAIAALADEVGQYSLSHYASRHGPQTTIDEHVARVATGFAPDDARPVPGTRTVLSRDWVDAGGTPVKGEYVTVPDVREMGPHGVGAASRIGSAEEGLFMVEDALSDAHAARSGGEVGDNAKLVKLAKNPATGPVVGDAVELEKVGTDYVDDAGTPLSSPKQLRSTAQLQADKEKQLGRPLTPAEATAAANATKSDLVKQQIIDSRAKSVMIDREVRSSKVVMVADPDGGFRTVTAFPEKSVAAEFGVAPQRQTRLDNSTPPAAPGPDPMIALTQAAQDAETLATTARSEADNARKAAEDSVADGFAAVMADPAHVAELSALQQAARAEAAARSERDAAAAALLRGQQVKTELEDRKTEAESRLSAATTAVGPAKLAHDTTPGDRALEIAWRAATEEEETAKADLATLQSRLDRVTTLVDEMGEANKTATTALDEATRAAGAAADAARKAGASAEHVTAAAATGAAMQAAVAACDAKLSELRTLAAKADFARNRLDEAREAADPAASDASDTNVAAMRAERGNTLKDALARGDGDFEAAKQAWLDEVASVEKMFADDADLREETLARLKEAEEEAAARMAARVDALAQAAVAQSALSPGDDGAAAQTAVDTARAELEKAREALKSSRRDLRTNEALVRAQKLLDAAAVGVARARAEAVAAEVRAAKAEADGAPDAVALRQAATLRRAEEDLAEAQYEDHRAREDLHDAKTALRLVQLDNARLNGRILAAEDEVARSPVPKTREMARLEDVTLPALRQRKQASDGQLAAARTGYDDAIRQNRDAVERVKRCEEAVVAAMPAN
ncbi:MAG: hypothetical protein ACU0CN_02980 [Pseudooceanicola nanhaiensis]|uniref:hypothetical protein n=1 Tax=Pseudooceanicola nanhaiensis TaxID=375761 RepID=UPI004057F472